MPDNRIVLRFWWWNLVGFVTMAGMAVTLLATVDSTTDRLVQAAFLGPCIFLAFVAVRFLLRRVVVRPEGLLVAGAVRTRRIPRETIRDVTCDVLAGGQVLTAFAPVVHLVDGREVEVNVLAAYSETVVQERREWIRRLLRLSGECPTPR